MSHVVVKPLPARQIGATLLRPYTPAADKQRIYPVRRPYAVNVLASSSWWRP